MKRKITFILLLTNLFLFSQSPLDTIKQFSYKKHYNLILKESKNQKSEYYYSKQVTKFINDETQNNFEVLCLMIGFSDNLNFTPYQDILTVDKEIYELNNQGKYIQAIEYGNKVLLKNPFMIKVLRELAYAYGKIGNYEMGNKLMERTGKIYNAMFYSSSITGTNIKEPMFSLGPKDGQYFIKYFLQSKLGDMGSGFDSNGHFIDILSTVFKEYPATYYFNIEHTKKTMIK